jgi:hypothetical protein
MINNDNNIILYLQMRMSTKLIADFISFNTPPQVGVWMSMTLNLLRCVWNTGDRSGFVNISAI